MTPEYKVLSLYQHQLGRFAPDALDAELAAAQDRWPGRPFELHSLTEIGGTAYAILMRDRPEHEPTAKTPRK